MNDREVTKNESVRAICEKLTERNMVLFLGAGINHGIQNDKGDYFPLGDELSKHITKDILGNENIDVTLDEASEMARQKIGEEAFNKYLYDMLKEYKPGTQHLSLVQLPWDVIYTTNFDLLVEEAYKAKTIDIIGKIQPIFSNQTELSSFTEDDILYYKLHGSVDYANSDGKLILSKEDYRHYLNYRKPLFKRLENDIQSKSIVFIGYALKDSNIRAILEDCRECMGAVNFPKSFAVRPSFSKEEEIFWKDKYNIQLIEADGSEYLQLLKTNWIDHEYRILPFDQRKMKLYFKDTSGAQLQKLGESFYVINPDEDMGKGRPKEFYRGCEPNWGDIKDEVPAERDIFWPILETLFPEISNPSIAPSLYLITGAAGTGKTSLIYSLGYEIAKSLKQVVLLHITGTPFDINVIKPLVGAELKRIVIIIKNASECISGIDNLLIEAKQKAVPITLLLEERRNQWETAVSHEHRTIAPLEFDLGMLSEKEIDNILNALEKYDMLGKLSGFGRDYQKQHFIALANKELLVALRELTSGGKFDDIVQDEYNKIPLEIAKRAYLYVAALGQIDSSIRFETLIRILKIDYQELKNIFLTTKGILITGEEIGSSRHNYGYRLRTRHPIIASIIFSKYAENDDDKFTILNDILSNLDPGYIEDKKLLQEITRKRDLGGVFASLEKRRAIYERLEIILPDNPYVFQHRSILERELGSAELATKYARKAVSIDNKNMMLQNTLGLALEKEARNTTDAMKYRVLVNEATKIFDDGISKNALDGYNYIGKVYLLRQEIKKQTDEEQRAILLAKGLSFLEEAYERTKESKIIAKELAIQKEQLGEDDNAKRILRVALKKEPSDERLRDILIRFETKSDEKTALALAEEGAKLNATSWRMQLHIARLKRKLDGSIDAIQGHYESVLRNNRGDIDIIIELGSFLFMHKKISLAKEIFSQARNLPIPSNEKSRIRQVWKDEENQRLLFSGKVTKIDGIKGFVTAIPQNFEAFFWKTRSIELGSIKERDSVNFYVEFNAYGPYARIVI